jgi:hypothetical protein
MIISSTSSFGLLTIAGLFASACFAVQPDLCSRTSTTTDVRVTLALPSDHNVFQTGEIIPLTLSFTSTAKGRYWADDRNYDRSGRLEIEHYCLEPEAPEPLQSYFAVGAYMGGGLFSTRALDTTLFPAHADLNEYASPAPGHYRLYVISDRVWRAPDPHEETPYGRISEIVRSNAIEFEVRPASAQWQQQQLQDALAILANAPETKPGPTKLDDPVRLAARQLRFLNTRQSTQQLAKLFSGRGDGESYGWEFAFGLFGSPYRQLAIDSMRKEFAAPGHAITADFLETLVRLQITADPAWEIPESFSSESHPDDKAISDFSQRRRSHEQELIKAESDDLLAALPRKVGRARALTALGLLSSRSTDAPFSPALADELRKALVASWKDLPADTRNRLIQYEWPLVAGPEMLPVLLGTITQPPPPARTDAAMARDAALRHIYELDPTAARSLIVADLKNRNAEPSLALLKLLPPEEIAPAIQPAIQRIAHNDARDLDFALLDRFADASVLGQVQAAFEPNLGKWACAPQSSMLRYLLRVAPEYGATQVTASLQARKDTHCYSSLLQELGDRLPPAEQTAIDALNDPDPEVIQDAVIALGRWGSSAAEPALWTRLERFHQEWSSHPDDLRSTPDYRDPGARAVALEQGLVSALAGGTGWLCMPEKLAELRGLVLTSANRQQIDTLLEPWKHQPFLINPIWAPDWISGQETTFNLLNSSSMTDDQLRAKIAEFPKGTRLAWQFWQPGQITPPVSMAKQEAAYESLRAIAEEHGIALEKANDP